MQNLEELVWKDELSEEEYKRLSEEEAILRRSRPSRARINGAKSAMKFRVTLIVLATAFAVFERSGINLLTLYLLFALAGYEQGYYTLRREKSEREYSLDCERFQRELKRLLRKRRQMGPTGEPIAQENKSE